MLSAHHNTVKTANRNSIINFYFVTGFYSKYDICIVLPFGHLILNLEVIEQYLETAVDSVYPDNDNERRFLRWLLQIASNYRNVMPKVKISNYFFFHPNKISYFCGQSLTILSKESLLV